MLKPRVFFLVLKTKCFTFSLHLKRRYQKSVDNLTLVMHPKKLKNKIRNER